MTKHCLLPTGKCFIARPRYHLPIRMSMLALAVCFSSPLAHADCIGSAGTYVCDGTLTSVVSISDTDISLTAQDGFSINVTGTTPALTLNGSGSIFYQDNHTSTLSSPGADHGALLINNNTANTTQDASVRVITEGVIDGGVWIENTSDKAAAVSMDVSGAITTTISQGILINNYAYEGNATVGVNVINAIDMASGSIHVTNTAYQGGALTEITANTITSASNQDYAVFAQNYATDYTKLTINVTDIDTLSPVGGILGRNDLYGGGDALMEITAGTITAPNGYYGIASVNNVFGGNTTVRIKVDAVDAIEGIHGEIRAFDGDALMDLTAGTINARESGFYILNQVSGANSTLRINADVINAAYWGIFIEDSAYLGNLSQEITAGTITARGSDVEYGGYGIHNIIHVDEGRSDLVIDVNSIDSQNDAIYIVDEITNNTSAASKITITAHSDIVSQDGTGIYVETTDADSYITVSGLVHGGGGKAIDLRRMNGIERSATLELRAGYALEGVTLATVDNTALDPANTHLVLGGSGNAGFDLSRIDNSADAIETGDANRITGFGTLTKSGDSVWTLSGANSADTADAFLYVNVDAGILALDTATLVLADAGSVSAATGIVTVAAGAGLSSIGASTVRGDVVNSGSIILANDYSGGNGSFVGDTLTISGNYTSNGGNLYLNTVLGDSSSATDKLVANTVTTGAGGATRIYVTNVGGLGALTSGDGIQIVQVATSSDSDAFVLGKPVTAGLYEYVLNQGTDQSWYLSSYLQPESGPDDAGSEQPPPHNPAIGAYLSNQTAATTLFMHTLYDRQGHANHLTGSQPQSAWARVVTRHGTGESVGGSQKTRTNSDVVHLGVDVGTWQVQDGNLHAGIMGAYGKSKTRVTSKATGTWAEGRLDGYSLGVYGTWFADEAEGRGLYVDGWTQYSWFKNKINGSAQLKGEEKYDSRLWTISAEAGYGFLIGKTANTEIMFTPQLQIAYNDYSADSHTDGNGLRVSGDKGSGAVTRVGARLYGRSTSVFTARPYVEVNWIYSDARNTLNFNGEVLRDDIPHNRLEAKLGVQGTIAKNWTLWGQAGVQWGKDSYHRYEGQFGLKYQW